MKDLFLIKGLKERDKVVFDFIFNYFYSSLCAFSMQFIKDRDEVEDLVQELFVSIWIKAPNLQINSSLKSFLFAGIRNRCLDYRKHNKVIEKYKSFNLFTAESEDHSSDHYFAESELRFAFENSMKKLPPRCFEIFEMSRLKGLSNQEIADKLGLSKRTIELQISNSLKILKKELNEFIPVIVSIFFID